MRVLIRQALSLVLSRALAYTWVRRAAKLTAIALIGIAGAWAGMLLGGTTSVQIGPVQTSMSLRPSLSGQTVVGVPPLGDLRMDTDSGPLQLVVDVRQLNQADVRKLVADPHSFADLPDVAVRDLRHGVLVAALRSLAAAALGSVVLGFLVFRRPWPALAAAGMALAALGACGAVAAAGWNPKAVLEPRYTGLLAAAPSLVGDVQDIVVRFGLYRAELAALVTNVTRLYDTTAALPVYLPPGDVVRVLSVSDIHDNPAAWNVMHSVVRQFGIDVIIDSGDLTDHGSQPEDQFTREIGTFGMPYVFVKGNHDSPGTVAAMARERNAIVLTGQEVTVDGLTITGDGDPRFTPNLDVTEPGEDAVLAMGSQLAGTLRTLRARGVPEPDIAVVHDPAAAAPLDGLARLVLAGHLHRRLTWTMPNGTRVFVQGSTGAAGLRALQSNPPTPIDASVLYFDRASGQLQAWDDITIGGLGTLDAQIQRHITTTPL